MVFETWAPVVQVLPTLRFLNISLRSSYAFLDQQKTLDAMGACVTSTLHTLSYDCPAPLAQPAIVGIEHLLKLPNLAGIRHLELPTLGKDDFETEAGLALLDECDGRSISLLCWYG